MDANQVFQIGPLQLPAAWIVAAAGVLIAVFLTEIWARKLGWEKEKWMDLIITAFLVFVLTYKFGDGLLDFKQIIRQPETLLWSSGSPASMILGIIFAFIALIYKIVKGKFLLKDVLRLSWIFMAITLFIYNLFIMDYGKTTQFALGVKLSDQSKYLYHAINWYQAALIGSSINLYFWLSTRKTVNIFPFYLLLGIGLLLISILDMNIHVYFGFTLNQIFYLLLGVIGGVGLLLYEQKDSTNK